MTDLFEEDPFDKEEELFGEDETSESKKKGSKAEAKKRKNDSDNSNTKKAKKTDSTDFDSKVSKFQKKQQQKSQAVSGIIDESIYKNYPMFISFMQGVKQFQKLMENLESTFPEITLVFDEKTISVFAIDNANVALVCINIPKESDCFDIYHCTRKFNLRVTTKSFASKFKKPEQYSSVAFIFPNEKEPNHMTIAMIDVTTSLIDCTELVGDPSPPEKELNSSKKIMIDKPIVFDTKYLAQTIFEKFKSISKIVLIGCDYSKLHIASGGESKNYLEAAKKRIVLPLEMKKNEKKEKDKQSDYIFIPEIREDGRISSTQIKQLNENLNSILQKSSNYESIDGMKKILESSSDSKPPPCKEYILDYITSILKIADLSEKVSIGFKENGIMLFHFNLSIGDMVYVIGCLQEEDT